MKLYRPIIRVLILTLLAPAGLYAQDHFREEVTLNWMSISQEGSDIPYFDGAFADYETGWPVYLWSEPLPYRNMDIEAEITQSSYLPCSQSEVQYLKDRGFNGMEPVIGTSSQGSRNQGFAIVEIIPFRMNPQTLQPEKLHRFNLIVKISRTDEFPKKAGRIYKENSVLNSGTWARLETGETGIYRITYQEIQEMGFDPSSVDPRNIRIYGNGGGMLPESNNIFRYDDLVENAIEVVGEEDGVFDPEDYILFFGQSPHVWSWIPLGYFDYRVHYYDDHTSYFLTVADTPGKRIEPSDPPSGNPTHTAVRFDDYDVYEEEDFNILKSGKIWYSDHFFDVKEYEYLFNFPNLVENTQVSLRMDLAARSDSMNYFVITFNDHPSDTVEVAPVNLASTTYARTKKKTLLYITGPEDEINIKVRYFNNSGRAEGWLNYLVLNALRRLRFEGGQMDFRNTNYTGLQKITEYVMEKDGEEVQVWDVTDPLNPLRMTVEPGVNELRFKAASDSLREFIAFDGTEFLTTEFVEMVENQNLHGLAAADMIIVTYPDFMQQAEALADLHREHDGMTIHVTTPQRIYNEFSSGIQDVSAIRDFMKMFYDRYGQSAPRYLLLFGDGSYDMKNREGNNTNYIPTYQTRESWNTANSYVIDDYFGILDDDEGNECIGQLDIGIGRLTVKNVEEAELAVQKIRDYMLNPSASGPWRQRIVIIGDDEDTNLHFIQSDSLARELERSYKQYNIKKIYLDAYEQDFTTSGDRYPQVKQAINDQMDKGTLIMNYVGHGGERGWAHERILEIPDIKQWTNYNSLPVFLTATCEFTRFDDPLIVTGGEEVFLNPNGGGIALFTTTRLAYSSSNYSLNTRFYRHVFETGENGYPRLGDLILHSKPPGSLTTRNFILLGDPALRLAYPEYKVTTCEVSSNGNETAADTIRAMDRVTVSGAITDTMGNVISGFNGIIHPLIYDKPTAYSTLANDPGSSKAEFTMYDKVIHKGKASVVNGHFEFDFVVPADIAPSMGQAKFSYYAWSDELQTDAGGYYDDIVSGGFNPDPVSDNTGPEIELFINDETFVSGNLTHDEPVLIAKLHDENGINH